MIHVKDDIIKDEASTPQRCLYQYFTRRITYTECEKK